MWLLPVRPICTKSMPFKLWIVERSFIWKKPPTPTLEQLTALLRHPRANQVAVGFQMSESPTLTALKRRLMAGELGKLEGVLASALWPRNTSYYERADWAGKMHLADRPVVDGPLTNALSHIVQNMFFLVGEDESSCAVPTSVSGYFARARPIESYDFAWIKGTLEGGIEFDILGGHCSDHLDPWKISLRTDRGIYSVGEADMPDTRELLLASHRSALAARGGRRGPTTGLADCCGYSVATTVGLASSSAVRTIPSSEIAIFGAASDAVYHVETLHQLVCRGAMTGEVSAAEVSWIDFGEPIGCANPLSDVELALSDEALHP